MSDESGDAGPSVGSAPTLSIVCTTYNQERFVRDALNGFLAQKAPFPIEILIHDDASTDDTPAIIEEYAAANPGDFRLIMQRENQYSQGHWPIALALSAARGDYIAICEGDDYWTDPDKLVTQVELLDEHPEASACFHRADGRFEETGETLPGLFGPPVAKPTFGVDDFLEGDNFVPTASLVLRRSACGVLPDWISSAPHADLVILTLAALGGPVLFIDKTMSVYRKHNEGIHTRDITAHQALKAVRTLIAIGLNLPVSTRESFRRGLTYRLSQVEGDVRRLCTKIDNLEARKAKDRETIEGIMGSRTFKLGLLLSRVRDRIFARISP